MKGEAIEIFSRHATKGNTSNCQQQQMNVGVHHIIF